MRATVRQADTSEYYIRVGEIRSRTLFNNSPVTHSVYTTLTGSVADSVMQDLPSSMDIDGAELPGGERPDEWHAHGPQGQDD